MNKPYVSVLMGVQNTEELVGEAIESVLNQTYQNFEFIILDDGSDDRTPEIIQAYAQKDSRIKPYFFKEKQGISLGCNFTLERAQGELIARIDGDDCWFPEKLEKQVEYMETHSDIGACFTWVKVIDQDGNELDSSLSEHRAAIFNAHNRTHEEWYRDLFYEGCRMAHPSSVVRKTVFKEVGVYNPSFRQLLDYELWVRIIKKYQIHMIEEILMAYRWVCGQNVSAASNEVMFRTYYEMYKILNKYFIDIEDDFFIASFKEKFRNREVQSPVGLKCEKAFLLLDYHFYHDIGRLSALNLFSELLEDMEGRNILKSQYGFDTFDFHKIQSEPIFYHSSLEKWPEAFEAHVHYLENLNEHLTGQAGYYQEELMKAQRYIADIQPELDYFRGSFGYKIYNRKAKKKEGN